MIAKCLECNYRCGSPFTLSFHYQVIHKDKMGKCACAVKSLSGICIKIDYPFKEGRNTKGEKTRNESNSGSSSRSEDNIYTNSSSRAEDNINANSNSNSNSTSNSNKSNFSSNSN